MKTQAQSIGTNAWKIVFCVKLLTPAQLIRNNVDTSLTGNVDILCRQRLAMEREVLDEQEHAPLLETEVLELAWYSVHGDTGQSHGPYTVYRDTDNRHDE